MSDIAIRAENLSKKYSIGGHRASYRTIREAVVNAATAPVRRAAGVLRGQAPGADGHDEIWALKDVSFEIKRGEVVGVIGPNGAGKSTLLKILSRITRPTSGYADIYGRVGSLLEVGTGFHPELTGRENVYLSGAVMGMKRDEIERRFDEIVDFSGVEKFIDTPIKHFSSGMYLRLAFAVAAHLDPEILVVDEVLAVGDAEFQKKCLGKMGEVAETGRTVLLVSHNMAAITKLSNRCMWIKSGQLQDFDLARIVANSYIESQVETSSIFGKIELHNHANVNGDLLFHEVRLLTDDSRATVSLFSGMELMFEVRYEVYRRLEEYRLILAIERLDGALVASLHFPDADEPVVLPVQPGRYQATIRVPIRLAPGRYRVQLAAKLIPGYWTLGRSLDWVPQALHFQVQPLTVDGDGVFETGSMVQPESSWTVQLL